MAQPITWQNVGLPQNMGANHLLTMAQEQYANAFQGLENIATGFRKDNIATDTANSEAQFNWFTEQARNLKPEQFTPETMNTLLANVTDPAARQAAVASFGKLGDELTNRIFTQEQRQGFIKDENQKELLRPIEVDKAKQGLKIGEAQLKSEEASAVSSYASANASNAATATNNLRTQALQMELDNAKNAQEKAKAVDALHNKYNADLIGGSSPAEVFDAVKSNKSLTPTQQADLLTKLGSSVNTLNTVDPILGAEIQKKTAKINADATAANKAIDTEYTAKVAKLPVDPIYSAMVGQEDVIKQVADMTSGSGDAILSVFGVDASGYSDANTLGEKLKAGLDETSGKFVERLDLELTPLIPDPKQRKAVIAEAQRNGGLYKVQSQALKLIPHDLREGKKVYELDDEGTEFTTEFNRTLGPYALSLANELEQRKHASNANAARLAIAGEQDKQLTNLINSSRRVGAKTKPDLTESIKANQAKQEKK